MNLNQAVAIVGVSCRFPGGSDLDEFWKTLEEGKCLMEEIRKDRWSIDAFYDPNKDAPGKTYSKHAAFIDNWNEWDNTFFGVNEAEAERMDPQHKIALECVYKATENAGISIDDLWGSNTSVYMGQMNDDKARLSERDLSGASSYTSTGIARSLLANRVSYTYNLQGPSMSLDTACSAGLVAVHQGIRSILSGESDFSICGGVTIIHSPSPFVGISKAHMASETGKCHAFSDQADGYARGEGCGVVVLKSVKQAKEDGDFIWGYIASTVNQDGHTVTPITAPSATMQEKLLRGLYRKINLDPKIIQYVEAHGTGTRAGDPVEIGSLGRVIGAAHDKTDPCLVGSVKTNIGHTESAAGIAGIIKVLLMMNHGKIAPSLNFEVSNPNIDLDSSNLTVPTSLLPWNVNNQEMRIAAVNSFGFGGTNAHAVIVQEGAETVSSTNDYGNNSKHGLKIVAFSGKGQNALIQSMADLLAAIKSGRFQDSILSMSFTSTARRSHFTFRAAFAVRDILDLTAQLERKIETPAQSSTRKEQAIVFVFGGMGTHWSGMGLQLMQCELVFRKKMEEIDAIIQEQEGWGVLNAIQTGSDLSDPAIGQPAIFAVQVSLATLWRSWGIHPRVVIGLSVGEVAAAHIAGKLTLTEAVKVICTRGKLLSQVTGGSMLVIGNMKVSAVKSYISQFDGKVEIGAHNSPVTCTISGDEHHIDAIHAELLAKKETNSPRLFLRRLPVTVAFHSHHVDSILQQLGDQLETLSASKHASSIDIISTVSGEEASDGDFTTGQYWQKNARQGALFWQGLQTISNRVENPIFVEISPKPALARNIIESFEVSPTLIIPSMKENDESGTIVKSLAGLHACGVNVDWKSFWGSLKIEISTFPRYQFQRKKLYFEPETITKWRLGQEQGEAQHKTRGMDAGFLKADGEEWLCLINKDTTPFVYDHRRSGKPLIPAAMYAEVGLSACVATSQNMTELKHSITNVSFVNACHLNQDDAETKIHVSIDHQPEMPYDYYRFFIKGGSVLLAEGNVQFLEEDATHDIVDIDGIRERCPEYFEAEDLYRLLETHKYTYGNRMRSIIEGVKNKIECLTKIVLSNEVHHEKRGVIIHPAILDSCFQLVALLFSTDDQSSLAVPVAINGLMVLGDPRDAAWIYMKITYQSSSQSEFSAHIIDCNGHELAKASRIVIKNIDEVLLQSPSELGYVQGWIPTQIEINRKQGEDSGQKSSQSGHVYHFYANNSLNDQFSAQIARSGNDPPFVCRGVPDDLDEYFFDSTPKVILFSLGVRPDAASHFTEPDLVLSEECCLALMNILKYCMNSKDTISVYVLTKHVHLHTENAPWYHLSGLPQLNANSSLIGSALWGFARTAIREGLRVICVDMLHCNIKEISKVASLVMGGTVPYPEWVFADCFVYRNEYLPLMGQKAKSHRAFPIRQDDIVQILKKVGPANATLKQDVIELGQNETREQVKVIRARLHSNRWFPTQWKVKPTDNYLINDEIETVLAIDYTVEMMSLDGHGQFFGCQPIPLAEVVHVDSRTLVPVSLLPINQPLLSVFLVSWDVLKNHSGGTKHIRIHNLSNMHILDSCLRSVANVLTCRVEDDESPVVTPLAIVIASKSANTPNALLSILQKSQKAVVLTSGTNFRVACAALLGERLLKNVSFYSHVDLFVPHLLVEMVPKFKTWLSEVHFFKFEIPCMIMHPTSNELNEGVIVDEIENQRKTTVIELPAKRKQNTTSVRSGLTYRTQNLFKSNGCYIIIGANKGQGLAFLKQMAALGAGVLIVISRTSPTEAVFKEYELLKKQNNVQIHWVQTDVTLKRNVDEAFQIIDKLRGKCSIKGVFHGAVVLADALIKNLTYEQFIYAYRVKVYGTYYLHCLTKDMELDYFVMHSSITAILGNIGQAAYGAANEFLNGFANYRRSIGLPGQSINWSTLKYGIIQWNTSAKRHLMSIGMDPLENDEVWHCMKHALLYDLTYISYGKFDLVKLIARGIEEGFGISSRLTFLANTAFLKSNQQSDSHVTSTTLSKKASEACTSEAKTLSYIEDIISDQLSISTEELSGSQAVPLVDLGFNSMDAVYVASKIEQDFIIHIDIDGHSSIDSLTTALWSKFEDSRRDTCVAEPCVPFKDRIWKVVQRSAKFRGRMSSFLTFEITNCSLNSDELVDKIKSIADKLPHLRTSVRNHPDGGADFLTRNVDSVKIQTASGTSMSPSKMRDNLTFLVKDLNVGTQTPFQVLINNSLYSESRTYIGMVFHRLVDDCHTMNQVVTLLFNSLHHIPQPAPLFIDKDNADQIQNVIDSKCSEEFWRQCLPGALEMVQMHSCFFLSTDSSEKFDGSMFKVLLGGNSYESMLSTSGDAGVSLNHYMLALYQLYIHFCSDANMVVVEMTIDSREILPENFRDYSGNLDTDLLIVSTLDGSCQNETSLETYIKEKCEHIRECVQHGLFPTQSMVDMIRAPGIESDKNIQFAFEYRAEQEVNLSTRATDLTVEVRDLRPSCAGEKSLKLYVVEKKVDRQLELYVLSGPGYFSEYGVKTFAAGLKTFLQTCSRSLLFSLQELSGASQNNIDGKITETKDKV